MNLLSDEDGAREVLLLSFTLNLEFWERYALSVARGLGARVTTVGDVPWCTATQHMSATPASPIRRASRERRILPPEAAVVAGEDYATVAIGSGNA
ncbi:MAG: hypothetical protein R3C15_15785 [Thermoleophilia bacterium]